MSEKLLYKSVIFLIFNIFLYDKKENLQAFKVSEPLSY